MPIASLAGQHDAEAAQPVVVPVESDEARNAGAPFDATWYPDPDELVPADCAWAFFAPPPEYAGSTGREGVGASLRAMEPLVGRLYEEITMTVGPPISDIRDGNNRSAAWGESGLLSGIWSVNLIFDRYDVCMGISSEVRVAF